jgi:hypothetical protein
MLAKALAFVSAFICTITFLYLLGLGLQGIFELMGVL